MEKTMSRLGHESSNMKRFFGRRLFKRGQTGQAIIVLAIGFIALLGFVGIVTDVSLLFVRYSSLSRAVDAAAVAAAGQMRRVPNDVTNNFEGEAASAATLSLAARQFIEIYGISPTTVLVETCRVQRFRQDFDVGGPAEEIGVPVDRNGVRLYDSAGAPNPAANAEDRELYEQLCTNDELKLVRVTAQIDAPTTFMSLLGYPTVTLTVAAISQTAVLDVVLIMDVSESMLTQTTYEDWEEPRWVDGGGNPHGYGYRYLPPRVNVIKATHPLGDLGWEWRDIVLRNQQSVMTDGIPAYPDLINDTADAGYYQPFAWVRSGVAVNQLQPPNQLCRVRIWPESGYSRQTVPAWLREAYIRTTDTNAPFADVTEFSNYFGNPAVLNNATYHGFVPQYNYFGCCNDPNGDFDFGDLVCEPFRQARDAAEDFLGRLDFLRGDRVAFVTFDRGATLIDPDGAGAQTPMIETQNDLYDGATLARRGAEEVLNRMVGVRAESNFYFDITNTTDPTPDGDWDLIASGTTGFTQQDFDTAQIASIQMQPVYNACPLDAIHQDAQYVAEPARYRWDGTNIIQRSASAGEDDTPLDDITTGGPASEGRNRPNAQMPRWVFNLPPAGQNINTYTRERDYSYEYRASCAGTNIGGALGAGSQALYLNGRREGAVWLMVMLSDGAAGASDPVGRYDGDSLAQLAIKPNPFVVVSRTGPFLNPYDATDPRNGIVYTMDLWEPSPGQYGGYGLCPYGYQDTVTGTFYPTELLLDRSFPACSDTDPATRTFCGQDAIAGPPNQTVVDNPDNPSCEYLYDVDDYARDWADWVGLANLNGASSSGGRVADQLLPTIFTIGFGLNYDMIIDQNGNVTGFTSACDRADLNCIRGISPDNEEYLSNYLGEELLRYIADVGDNFRMDSDYWQYRMGARIGNGITGAPTDDYGPRSACDIPEGALGSTPINAYAPQPPRTSCGNYFAAATQDDLNRVFSEIASRMFTRISQ
jgi:hypothetical protein